VHERGTHLTALRRVYGCAGAVRPSGGGRPGLSLIFGSTGLPIYPIYIWSHVLPITRGSPVSTVSSSSTAPGSEGYKNTPRSLGIRF
jgi:hypothetical protein